MRQLRDDEILALYQPRGLGRAVPEGERTPCVRRHCGRGDSRPGTRWYKWSPRHGKGAAIELCARCHTELATIVSGG